VGKLNPHTAALLKGVSSQVSMTISNIIANEDIQEKKEEKTALLSLSNDIAAIRNKADLVKVTATKIRGLLASEVILIDLIDPEKQTHSIYFVDNEEQALHFEEYRNRDAKECPVVDGVYEKILASEDAVVLDLQQLPQSGLVPEYIDVWRAMGRRRMAGMALRVGNRHIGTIWVYKKGEVNKHLLQGIAAQLSIAVSNILANDDIKKREEEKSLLLSFSNEIAAVKDKKGLTLVISKYLKDFGLIREYIIALRNEDADTYGFFLYDETASYAQDSLFPQKIDTNIHLVGTLEERAFQSDGPVMYNVRKLLEEGILTFPSVEYWEASDLENIYSVPLKVSDKMIGILWIQPVKINRELLIAVAAHISVAISNILAIEDIKEREKETSILLSFSNDIASVKDPKELQLIINRYLKNLFLIKEYIIAVGNDDGATFSFFLYDESASYTKDPGFAEKIYAKFPFTGTVTERIFNAAGAVYFNVKELVRAGELFFPSVEYWENIDIETIIAVPLRASDEFIGVLWIQPNQIKERLLVSLAAQISVAISNIFSIIGIKEREKEKASLLSFSNAIASAKEKQDLTRAIAEHLKRLFHIRDYIICVAVHETENPGAYIYDLSESFTRDPALRTAVYSTKPRYGPLIESIFVSPEPRIFDTSQMASEPELTLIAQLWRSVAIDRVTGFPLKVGDDNLGVIWTQADQINDNLFKAISAQIAIALANALANDKIKVQFDEINAYKQQLEDEKEYLKQEIVGEFNNTEILGKGPEMQRVYRLLSQVAYANSTVLLLGETGTGKELVARAIHNASPRRDKLMVKVNCAALPVQLIESELFGHEKGAFTGAYEKRIGKFELANHGTLFLDEIGELSLEMQAKLLRALQEKEIERIGGKTTITVDVRIIAATNRNLLHEVEEKRFRNDLYYRLNVFPITLPSLRDRKEDIPLLATHFLEKYVRNTGKKITSLSQKVMNELTAYSWPGNVRELEHLIERSVLLTSGPVIREVHLPRNGGSGVGEIHNLKTIKENERDYILEVLRLCNGKIFGEGGAAAILGIPVSTLNSRIKRLGISKEATMFKSRTD
jgi:formate hydrogenlyase transcriptional activator